MPMHKGRKLILEVRYPVIGIVYQKPRKPLLSPLNSIWEV